MRPEFSDRFSDEWRAGSIAGRYAIAVSGGPDSMALAWLASRSGGPVRAVTVDHDLRPDSAGEAEQVRAWLAGWPNVTHHILKRPAPLQAGRLMERARHDRYRLLTEFCEHHDIPVLLTAHHRDDQAETLLFRLAKGSGLDGLAGMETETRLSPRVTLVRPLLDVPKADLVALCEAQGIPYLNDPSNADPRFARARLRQALEGEGATAARLARTARRLSRARRALEFFAEEARRQAVTGQDANGLELSRAALTAYPEDVRVRVMAGAIGAIGGTSGHLRLDKIEALTETLFAAAAPCRVTLHRCIIAYDPVGDRIRIDREFPLA